MPTPLESAMRSKNAVIGFAGIVTAAAVWSIWGGDMFPAQNDPTGNPEDWSEDDMRRWMNSRGLLPDPKASRKELLDRIKDSMRPPPRN